MIEVRTVVGAFSVVAAVVFPVMGARAGDWKFGAGVSVSETASDNANLAPDNGNRKADLITRVTPNVSVTERGGRTSGALNYSYSQIYSANDTIKDTQQNTLQGSGNAELWKNHAFIDAQASIAQVSRSASGPQSQSEVGSLTNQTEVRSFRSGQTLSNRFGSFADGQIRTSVGYVESEASQITATTLYTAIASLASGREFGKIGWNVSMSRSETVPDSGQSRAINNANVGTSYAVTREFTAQANAGYQIVEDNSASNQPNEPTWSVGGIWTPSPLTRASASYGHSFGTEDITLAVDHSFSRRTRVSGSYNTLTRNTGQTFNSDTISASATHQFSPRTSGQVSYSETTNTTQTEAFNELQFLTVDDQGNLIDSRTGQPFTGTISIFGPTNSVFKSRSGSIGGRTSSRKTSFGGDLTYNERNTLSTGITQIATGVTGNVAINFSKRTTGSTSASYNRIEFDNATGRVDHSVDIAVRLSYRLFRNTSANIAYTYFKRFSGDAPSRLTENAVTAALSHRF